MDIYVSVYVSIVIYLFLSPYLLIEGKKERLATKKFRFV